MYTEETMAKSASIAIAIALLTVAGCKDVSDPEPEPEIETLQLTVSTPNPQTITVATNPGCAVTNGPIMIPINTAVAISASFRNAANQPDPIANNLLIFRLSGSDNPHGAEPAPTPSTIEWTRTGPFSGILNGSVATTAGSVQFSAFHLEEEHEDWGPCTIPITVTP
jgi:hypothetical protein